MTTYALLHTIFFFFVYAFLGWCVEVAYAAITTRELVNRGFLNGPICPIYGCGMTVMIAVLGRFTMPSSDMAWYQNVLVAFFGGMVITTLVELVGGYILYKMFHTRWWDYSMYRFNLGGFICPQFSLLWGLGSVLLMVAAQQAERRYPHPCADLAGCYFRRPVPGGSDRIRHSGCRLQQTAGPH